MSQVKVLKSIAKLQYTLEHLKLLIDFNQVLMKNTHAAKLCNRNVDVYQNVCLSL